MQSYKHCINFKNSNYIDIIKTILLSALSASRPLMIAHLFTEESLNCILSSFIKDQYCMLSAILIWVLALVKPDWVGEDGSIQLLIIFAIAEESSKRYRGHERLTSMAISCRF